MHNATNRYIIFKIIIANLKDTTIQHQSVYCFYIKTTEKNYWLEIILARKDTWV